MSSDNGEEFQLDFEDEAVDMTNLNRQNYSNSGSYGNTYGNSYNSTYNNSYDEPPQHNDIYGVYDPSRDRAVTGSKKYGSKSAVESILNILHYVALVVCTVSVAYFVVMKKYDIDSYKSIMALTSLFMEIVFVLEAIVLYHRHRRMSLIVTGIFLPILYPFFRCNVLGKSKKIPSLWIVAYLVVCVMFVKGALANYDMEYGCVNKYPSKYESTMKMFKDYNSESNVKTIKVMSKSFRSYSLDVKVESEDAEYIYVELDGNAKVAVDGIERPDTSIPHNVVMTFKVKKSDGSYSVEGLTINKNNHDASAKLFWSALCINAGK